MAYWLGAITGALIFSYLWSRLWLWLVKKFGKLPDPKRTYVAYALAWFTAIIVGGYGFADGGPWNGARAFLAYTPALALWLIIDLFARKGRQS